MSKPALIARRLDVEMDADGDCSVCGCSIQSAGETVQTHRCPPGFRVAAPAEKAGNEAYAHLLQEIRSRNPSFFQNPEMRGLAEIYISELSEELAQLDPITRLSVIAASISFAYKMGEAAVLSVSDKHKRKMGQILIDKHHENLTSDGQN